MSHTAPKGDGQISHVHNMALRDEIGERLRFTLIPIAPIRAVFVTSGEAVPTRG